MSAQWGSSEKQLDITQVFALFTQCATNPLKSSAHCAANPLCSGCVCPRVLCAFHMCVSTCLLQYKTLPMPYFTEKLKSQNLSIQPTPV